MQNQNNMRAKIVLILSLIAIISVSCKSKVYFNKLFKNGQGTYYLCYIASEPEEKDLSTSDSVIVINSLENGNQYNGHRLIYLENYDMIMFDIKIVDVFKAKKAYDFSKYIHNGLGRAMPSKDFFINDYDKVYMLLDKNHQSSKTNKNIVKRSFKQKKLILLPQYYDGVPKVMICNSVYELNKRMSFEYLITIE